MSGKKGAPNRPGKEPEDNEVVHLQEITARDANDTLDLGASVGVRRVAFGFHDTWFEWAMTVRGSLQIYGISRSCQSGKRVVRSSFFPLSIRSNLGKTKR